VTDCSGHIGDTFSVEEELDALDGVYGDGRTNEVCGSPFRSDGLLGGLFGDCGS